MWPDTPEDYKTPLGLNIAIWIFIIVVSCIMAIPFALAMISAR